MAQQEYIDEYKALGGTENVAALSDDEVRIKINELLGINPIVTQDALALPEMVLPAPAPKTPKQMSDQELIASMLSPEDMEAFASTGAVAPELAEQQMRDLTDSRDLITNLSDPATAGWVAERMAKQAGANALNTFDVPAQAAGLYGLASLGTEELANLINGDAEKPNFGSAAALDFANDRYKEALATFDTSEPRNIQESLAGITGMMIPVPGSGKLSAVGNLAEIATPLIIGNNKVPRLATNFAAAALMDQGVRELTDQPGDQYQTAFDLLNLSDEDQMEAFGITSTAMGATLPFFAPAAARALAQNPPKPPTIKAINDLDRLGPDNLYTITKNSDLLSGYILSDTDSVLEIARRAGVPNFDDLQKQFDNATHSGANARVVEAVSTGSMPTVHGNFAAPVSPRQLAAVYDLLSPQQQVDLNNYMLLGNYADVIKRRQAHDANALALHQQALQTDPQAPAPTMIAKATDQQELTQIAQQRATMRMNMPMLNEFSQGYQQLTEEARRFISEGPYALIDKATKARFDKEQPHYVPIQTTSVDPNDTLLRRVVAAQKEEADTGPVGSPAWLEERDIANIDMNTLQLQQGALPSIVDYVQSVLQAQMQNNARGAYVDAMMQSTPNQAGTPLIRRAKGKEVEKYPDRIVTVTRNGKDEKYITESYIARTLKLDPYILTNPVAMGLFMSRRAFETGTTGVTSFSFPLTSAIRDTISGWANTTKGQKAPGFGVITAPFEILTAKATKAFYTAIEDRLAAGQVFIPGVDANSQKQLAARLAATYQNSFYHLAQQHGGYDASIMRDRIKLAKGALGEVQKAIPWPVSRTYNMTLAPLISGLTNVLDAMMEAPRYNAAKRNTKAGVPIDTALAEAKKMTGDTSKSGKVYDAQGRRITGDTIDPEKGLFNEAIGGVTEFARIAAPYFNPMVQGMRRVATEAVADPVRFAARNWLAVGLPAMAAYAWNQMLSQDNPEGYDYTDYAFNVRSGDEQVMELYIGIPGQPPEKGISIPIAHESTPFMAPFQTALYHMGGGGDDLAKGLTTAGLNILGNSAEVGLPPVANAFLQMQGISGVGAMIGANSPYETREDNIGVLPQNMENTMRALFGTQAAIGLEAASAFADDGDLLAAGEEFMNSIAKRLPIVKGIGGWRTNSAYFTPVSLEQRKKLDAYNAFDEAWTTHMAQEGVVVSPSSPPPSMFPDVDKNGDMLEIPFGATGPVPTARPVNPLYALYGQQIHDTLAKKDPYGFPATKAQMGALTDQIRLLRGFNAGRRDDYQQWQDWIENAPTKITEAEAKAEEASEAYEALKKDNGGPGVTGAALQLPEVAAAVQANKDAERQLWMAQEYARTAKFLEDNKIDLGNRFDVIRLTNLLEQRRVDLMKYQLSIIEQVENDLTQQLQAQSLMSPQDHFRFETHLKPDANPGIEAIQEPLASPLATAQTGAE